MVTGIVLLGVQAALAVIMLELLRVRVLPAVGVLRMPGLMIDVWLPLALACPMIGAAATVGADVKGWGWVSSGLPALAPPLGLAGALLLGGGRPVSVDLLADAGGHVRVTGWTIGAAIILILVAAIGVLSSLAGQIVFALAAVLLWINTPEEPDVAADSVRDRADSRAWNAMAVIMLLAVLQGACVALQSPVLHGEGSSLSTAHDTGVMRMAPLAILCTQLLIATLHAGRLVAVPSAVRLACWTGVYGSLLGIGVLSLATFLPAAIRLIDDPTAKIPMQIGHGFGVYAPEAAFMLAAALLGSWVMRPAVARGSWRSLGAVLLLLALGLMAWRLAGLVSTSAGG